MKLTLSIPLSLSIHNLDSLYVSAFRVGSEKLKNYIRSETEHLLKTSALESIFWPNEPLSAKTIAKATGVNITLAETCFDLRSYDVAAELSRTPELKNQVQLNFVRDCFVTFSAERDRSYTLTINLELNNPFKVIDILYNKQIVNNENQEEVGSFEIRLPQSTFLVQLSQRINYDECLTVNYVQLAPNVSYEIICESCTQKEHEHLDRSFSKRMTQLDAELDALLSEKLLLGLGLLLSQQRLDLDAHLS